MKTIQSNIKKAKKYLDDDDCIAIPTETVYGLAGNAYSNKAVKKIFVSFAILLSCLFISF